MTTVTGQRGPICYGCQRATGPNDHWRAACYCHVCFHRKCLAIWQLRELPLCVICPQCQGNIRNPIFSKFDDKPDWLSEARALFDQSSEIVNPGQPLRTSPFDGKHNQASWRDPSYHESATITVSSPEGASARCVDRNVQYVQYEQAAVAEYLRSTLATLIGTVSAQADILGALSRLEFAREAFVAWNHRALATWPVLDDLFAAISRAHMAEFSVSSLRHSQRDSSAVIENNIQPFLLGATAGASDRLVQTRRPVLQRFEAERPNENPWFRDFRPGDEPTIDTSGGGEFQTKESQKAAVKENLVSSSFQGSRSEIVGSCVAVIVRLQTQCEDALKEFLWLLERRSD